MFSLLLAWTSCWRNSWVASVWGTLILIIYHFNEIVPIISVAYLRALLPSPACTPRPLTMPVCCVLQVLSLITFICAVSGHWWYCWGCQGWVDFVALTAFFSTLIMFIFYLIGLYSRFPSFRVLIVSPRTFFDVRLCGFRCGLQVSVLSSDCWRCDGSSW